MFIAISGDRPDSALAIAAFVPSTIRLNPTGALKPAPLFFLALFVIKVAGFVIWIAEHLTEIGDGSNNDLNGKGNFNDDEFIEARNKTAVGYSCIQIIMCLVVHILNLCIKCLYNMFRISI